MEAHNGLGLMVLGVFLVGAQIVLAAATRCNVSDPGHMTVETKDRSTEALPGSIGGAFGVVAIIAYIRSGRQQHRERGADSPM